MDDVLENPRWVKKYLVLSTLEVFFTLIALFVIPSDAKNAWFMGYSRNRIFMGGGVFLILIWVFWLYLKYRRSPDMFKISLHQWLSNETIYLWMVYLSSSFFIAGVFGIWLAFVSPSTSPFAAYSVRIIPVLVLGIILGIQTRLFVIWPGRERYFLQALQKVSHVVKKTAFPLWFIFITALVGIIQRFIRYGYDALDPDAQVYRLIISQMSHPYDTGIREPIWIWLVSFAQHLFGNDDLALRFLGISLFFVTGYILYRLVLDTFENKWRALLTVTIFLWNDFLQIEAIRGLRDSLFVMAVVSFAYFIFSKHPRITISFRLLGLILFYALAAGTRVTSLVSLGIFMILAFWIHRIHWSFMVFVILVITLVLGPYLYSSNLNYGDPMVSSNIHATLWRNYEYLIIKETDCDGCPSLEEFEQNPYSGSPITMTAYVFSMHSYQDLAIGSLRGLGELYFSPSELFCKMIELPYCQDNLGIVYVGVFILGAILLVLKYPRERYLLLLPLMVTNILVYFVILKMPYRIYIVNAPFMILVTSNGLIDCVHIMSYMARQLKSSLVSN